MKNDLYKTKKMMYYIYHINTERSFEKIERML